ncbi:hypothetical protein DZC30_06415 [Comamonas testosteroni]|uniref:Uncharacterized protein n=1 Tax=Comamonas testosteroni TaxID=285 RepID=A0A373FP48_COMTE|nr:hypothetical protein DZC30_06415 [Comamonas testosteroni]
MDDAEAFRGATGASSGLSGAVSTKEVLALLVREAGAAVFLAAALGLLLFTAFTSCLLTVR